MKCTYMWREYPFIRGDRSYRFQTNDSSINKKMRQRQDFKLAMWGLYVVKTIPYIASK